MDQVEPHAGPGAAQHTAHIPQEKGGAAVVAETQQQLCLLPGEKPLPPEVGGSLGSGRIAAQKPRGKGHGAYAPQAEHGAHEGSGEALQYPGKTQLQQQRGHHKKGEQGGDHRAPTQFQTPSHGPGGRLRAQEQKGAEKQNR